MSVREGARDKNSVLCPYAMNLVLIRFWANSFKQGSDKSMFWSIYATILSFSVIMHRAQRNVIVKTFPLTFCDISKEDVLQIYDLFELYKVYSVL